jgi:hypothetical protein
MATVSCGSAFIFSLLKEGLFLGIAFRMSVPPTPPPTQLGNETRTSILPTITPEEGPGLLGPDYDFAGELPMPADVGVRSGSSMGSVINAVSGSIYYTDMIGFGDSSNRMTRGFQRDGRLRPLGVNYFTPTGGKCSNGADMWMYVNGIPTGESLGTKVKTALQRSGLPGLRGLAPGILEDSQAALNPMPVLRSVFGTGYPRCRNVILPVGDSRGRLRSDDPSVPPWIPNQKDIVFRNGRPFQSKWVQDVDGRGNPVWLTQEEWQREYDVRSYCPDGILIERHQDRDCSKPVEGWVDYQGCQKNETATTLVLSAVLLGCLGIYMASR